MVKASFLIGKPRTCPQDLLNNLSDLFQSIPDVKAAYVAQIFNPMAKERAHLAIGVEMDNHLNTIAYKIGEIIKKSVPEGEPVDLIHLEKEDIKKAFSTLKPFYQKNI